LNIEPLDYETPSEDDPAHQPSPLRLLLHYAKQAAIVLAVFALIWALVFLFFFFLRFSHS
jgi:hypothetical protein